MGPQGSGKGTQAARLAASLGIPTISTGDIFRANIAGGTELGRLAASYTDRGELVPDEVTDSMVASRLAEADVAGGFILDGYPRNAAQVTALDAALASLGLHLDGVIELAVPDALLLDRITKRAEIEGRADDTPESIARRLAIYAESTAPLLAEYGDRGLLVKVDGAGDVDTIFTRIQEALATRLA